MRLKRETAAQISSVNDLLENRFLVVSKDYVDWVDAEEERKVSKVEPLCEVGCLTGALLESRGRERPKTLRMALRRGRLEHTISSITCDRKRQKRLAGYGNTSGSSPRAFGRHNSSNDGLKRATRT